MIWHDYSVAFSILGQEVHWYGLVYIGGFLLSLWLGWKIGKKLNLRMNSKEWENIVFALFFAGILGGRLGEFIFYAPHVFWTDPLEIFKVWKGGMSIHGGLIGAFGYGWWWTQKHRVDLLKLSDALMLPLAITLVFGRVANFLNGELYGLPVEGQNWGVIFPHVDGWLRHPTQLYEAGYGAILVGILVLLWQKNFFRFRGLPTVAFLAGYGVFRFIVEIFKVPDGMIGPLTTGQALCILMVIAAAWLAGKQNFWESHGRR